MNDHDRGTEDVDDHHPDVAMNVRDSRVDDRLDADPHGGDRDRLDDDHDVNHLDGVARVHASGKLGDAHCLRNRGKMSGFCRYGRGRLQRQDGVVGYLLPGNRRDGRRCLQQQDGVGGCRRRGARKWLVCLLQKS